MLFHEGKTLNLYVTKVDYGTSVREMTRRQAIQITFGLSNPLKLRAARESTF